VAPPDPAVVDRLRKLLGMLGSDHEGERATAGKMADTLLRQHKLTWADVVGADSKGAAPRVRTWHEASGFREQAAECLAWPEVLTDWETEFLRSISGRWHLTPRQRHFLDRIVSKVRAYARTTGATFT
jgi:hypothetical protein